MSTTENTNQSGTESAAGAGTEQPKVFDESYVKKLRDEAAQYRIEAKSYKSKVDEYSKLEESQKAEQGKFKELYEEAQGKLKTLDVLTEEINQYRAEIDTEIGTIKKTLDAESVTLIDSLPTSIPAKQRLELARKLAGKRQTNLPASDRAGSDSTTSTDSVIEAYRKADGKERMRMLFQYENSNNTLYNQLLKIR